ncbi:NlpC/P60 family protein [Streptosporangium lutulentum]|uniref:NlpC/P60 domain-containing protein n=1 Tax=Streptosporangium lutulentum TaxID=1461250 RepID=A0ABT9QVR6_9ACTN|nr:NlpC/P60 family protein [Streptosporangium lutulentum]MDP9850506.1 hypothetical protein [Streptosporangium lutulentum]
MSQVTKAAAVLIAAVFAGMLALLTMASLSGGASAPASADQPQLKAGKVSAEYLPWVLRAGQMCPRYAFISPVLIAAQITAESAWNPQAISPVASGLAQFTAATWAQFGHDEDGDGTASPFDPPDAIIAMGRYDCHLAEQLARVPGERLSIVLAGYNAGPQAVLKHGGVPPFPETQDYIRRINALMTSYGRIPPPAQADGPSAQVGGSSLGARIVAAARAKIGTPYSWGGGGSRGPSTGVGRGAATVGFDCSGLIQFAAFQASNGALQLPRTSQQQVKAGVAIARNQMQPGDLIGFDNPHDSPDLGFGHIGIYIGNGQMVHAPQTGDVVKIADLSQRRGQIWAVRRLS